MYHPTQIEYLDLTLMGHPDSSTVTSRTFRKPCAGNSLLQASSCHPSHTIKSLPTGEFIGVRRNCSTEMDFLQECTVIQNRLKERGYSVKTIARSKNIALQRDRAEMLRNSSTKKHKHCSNYNKNKVNFVTTFSLEYNKIVAILKECLPILYADKDLYSVIKGGCNFSCRRAPSLGSMLSPSLFCSRKPNKPQTWLSTTGSYMCGLNTCKQCHKHKKSTSVTSFTTNKTYAIKQYINCSSKSVVYVIQCSACNLQYVGCTIRPLRVRISEHVNDTTNTNAKNILNVSKHFREVHHGNLHTFSFLGAEQVKKPPRGGDTHHILLKREVWWIHTLNTRKPYGLNDRMDINLFLT